MSFWVKEVAGGYGTTFEALETIYSAHSPYQRIDIYRTEKLGVVLMLDGIIQLTEYDEFAYQEMMAHPVLMAHPDPKRVLVIGGGDGGVLREAAKHPGIEELHICEIDRMVIDAARRFIPSMARGYDDPRVTIHVGDGAAFVRAHEAEFDVVIVDSTDPAGPGEALFNETFYRGVRGALRAGGLVASQAESAYLLPDIVSRLVGITHRVFARNYYGMIAVPTYPTGTIGVCVAALDPARDPRVPARKLAPGLDGMLKYYTEAHHRACFELPKFVRNLVTAAKSARA